MTATTQARNGQAQASGQMPVLLGLAELVELFPEVTPNSVYRWRISRNGAPPALPAPALTVSKTPMWTEDVVLGFAADKKLDVDKRALRRIRKEQGHR